MKNINKRRQEITLSIVVIGLSIMLMGVASILTTTIYTKSTTDSIAKNIIRFHVVANSDSTEDQLLKESVRDAIIEYMRPLVKNSTSIEETKKILKRSIPHLKKIAEKVIDKHGEKYEIYVALDKANFPTKEYGDVVLPAGEYEACRVVIGEGKGKNWWCVMYPPLCYLDVSTGVVPLEGKEQLQEELNSQQYKLVTQENDYQIRFKLIDTINSLFLHSNYNKIEKEA